MTFVMDSSALIAYLGSEPGAEVVDAIMMDTDNTCYVHAMNACEVYYDYIRRADEFTAKTAIDSLVAAGLFIVDDMDTAFWQQAGCYKAGLKRISLADCVCLTLADRVSGEIITTDHHEFGPVADQGLCKVRFIR